MTLKKKKFAADEIAIYEDAIVYKRGDIWQFRMWLEKEGKYARSSLKTTNQSTAIDKAKLQYHELKAQELAGKSYFSKTVKEGVELYLAHRQKDVDTGNIVKGRLGTIKTHLDHFMNFIGKDTKLKDLHRMDCEKYQFERKKSKKSGEVSNSTISNEQSTFNSMIKWLHKHGETYIDSFDFQRIVNADRGNDNLRRSIFDENEIWDIRIALDKYISEAKKDLDNEKNLTKFVTAIYLMIASITGLRTGEQRQLIWEYIEFLPTKIKDAEDGDVVNLVKVFVPFKISKWKKSRNFCVHDKDYFMMLQDLMIRRYKKTKGDIKGFSQTLIFSTDGVKQLPMRAIKYHFDNIVELAGIKNVNKRILVPYSFRHSYITYLINMREDLRTVADLCGTSETEIEKTYYHLTEKRMIENALPSYRYENGLLIAPEVSKQSQREIQRRIKANSLLK